MTNYSNKTENYDFKRNAFLISLHPAAFAEFCGTIHVRDLKDEVSKLIPLIKNKQTEVEMFKSDYEHKKEYICDFLNRAVNAIADKNLDNIKPSEEKHILFAIDAIIRD